MIFGSFSLGLRRWFSLTESAAETLVRLGVRLRELRNQVGLSQEQLAKASAFTARRIHAVNATPGGFSCSESILLRTSLGVSQLCRLRGRSLSRLATKSRYSGW